MVTVTPRPEQIICNKCGKQIGTFNENGEFTQSEDVNTFMRHRIYDVDHNGERFVEYEYEADFCEDCSKQWGKLVKKFKLTQSKVRPAQLKEQPKHG